VLKKKKNIIGKSKYIQSTNSALLPFRTTIYGWTRWGSSKGLYFFDYTNV